MTTWGSERDSGSLCHLKDISGRRQVGRDVKVFNVGDEFLRHAFEAHLLAAITNHFNLHSPSDNIADSTKKTHSWLRCKAEKIVQCSVLPCESTLVLTKVDELYMLHRRLLYMGFLYLRLRDSIRREDGPRIISAWKYWLVMFLGSGRRNYSTEAANLLANLKADWSPSMAYIQTYNRTVNMTGESGGGKPIDQMLEHYNL